MPANGAKCSHYGRGRGKIMCYNVTTAVSLFAAYTQLPHTHSCCLAHKTKSNRLIGYTFSPSVDVSRLLLVIQRCPQRAREHFIYLGNPWWSAKIKPGCFFFVSPIHHFIHKGRQLRIGSEIQLASQTEKSKKFIGFGIYIFVVQLHSPWPT